MQIRCTLAVPSPNQTETTLGPHNPTMTRGKCPIAPHFRCASKPAWTVSVAMPSPEQKAREQIEAQLSAAGWVVQYREDMNLGASLGIAVREYPLATGPCDYLLFVDRTACGVGEAKPEGNTLSDDDDQASRYQHQVPQCLALWSDPMRFDFEVSAPEILISDRAGPDQRSRYLFGFQRPEALRDWLEAEASLRSRPSYADLAVRDKLNLGIFWPKDDGRIGHDSLPPPDEVASEIVENLEAALERFRKVAANLAGAGEQT